MPEWLCAIIWMDYMACCMSTYCVCISANKDVIRSLMRHVQDIHVHYYRNQVLQAKWASQQEVMLRQISHVKFLDKGS